MLPSIRLEIKNSRSGEWVHVGAVTLGDPDGSISDNNQAGRDVYLFGVDPIANIGYIKRSESGIDTANSKTRSINSAGFVTIAALHHLESHELTVNTDLSTAARCIRFTYFQE